MSSCENTETTACSVYPLRAYFSAANAEISSNTQILKANYSKYSTGTFSNIAFVLGFKLYLRFFFSFFKGTPTDSHNFKFHVGKKALWCFLLHNYTEAALKAMEYRVRYNKPKSTNTSQCCKSTSLLDICILVWAKREGFTPPNRVTWHTVEQEEEIVQNL